MRARIYQKPRNAMQSGWAATHDWVLVYEPAMDPAERQHPDALMGWIGGGRTQNQVRLTFPTRDAAVAYANAQGIAYEVEPASTRTVRPKSYADNFRYGRIDNWTH